jgi:hypothetical protein
MTCSDPTLTVIVIVRLLRMLLLVCVGYPAVVEFIHSWVYLTLEVTAVLLHGLRTRRVTYRVTGDVTNHSVSCMCVRTMRQGTWREKHVLTCRFHSAAQDSRNIFANAFSLVEAGPVASSESHSGLEHDG